MAGETRPGEHDTRICKENNMADNMITIDASALSSFNYNKYITDYFASLGATAGASSWYGGIPYTDASQVGFRYAGTENDAQVLLQGEGLAYDGAPSHAISGSLDGFTLGAYDSYTTSTVVDAETGEVSELQNVIAGLEISGLGYSAASGSGTTNPVYVLYNALRKANTVVNLDADGDSGYEYIDLIYSLLGAKAQHFIGSEGDDVYTGTIYSDLIDGGLGADSLAGGAGDDTYVTDVSGDLITELADEGTDTVETARNHYPLGANIENLVQTGGADLFGYGNALDNTMTGNSGVSTLMGQAGNDTLYGGLGADTLNGGEGNDYLDGQDGIDTMVGGAGDDIYVTDVSGETITELADEGTDTVETARNHYPLGANLENLIQTGSADLFGYGNELDNVMTGNDGNNYLGAIEGNDTLHGGLGTDTLDGGAGNDYLDGGTGTDTMIGGAGDDIFIFGAGDVVSELADGGRDTIRTTTNNFALGDFVENLTLTGVANLKGTGNSLSNVLTGNTGSNSLSGLLGNDTLNGGQGNDTLNGNEGRDTLSGGTGADRLFGGAGQDSLTGNAGADTFFFANADTATSKAWADTILDFSGNQGDLINLVSMDANEARAGNQRFDFIGTARFSGDAGELRYEKTGSDTYIYADTDGDRRVDFTIHLDDAVNLSNDFFAL